MKFYDWLIPLILLVIIINVGTAVMMTNPKIKLAALEKTMEKIEQQFEDMVEAKQMSREMADQQLEKTRESIKERMSAGIISQVLITLVTMFIIFFIIAAVYFFFAKVVLKGEGTYSHALSAYGLPMYISMLQWIIAVILALLMERMITDTSVATLIDADKSTFLGFVLSKIDVFSIWFYAVVSIALAKLFKSASTIKYFVTIFGLWIGFGLLFFILSKFVPFLGMFMGN